MGIREKMQEANSQNLILEIEVKSFSDVGYWLRTIKQKLKKVNVLKIKLKIDIVYYDYKNERL